MEGVVFKLFERHHGAKGAKHVLVVQADSRTLNPTLRKQIVQRAFEEDATGASAEYGGEFRAPLTRYIERAVVQRCVEAGVTQRPRLPHVRYVGFVDVSGGSGQDSYCCGIAHMQHHEGRDVCVIDALHEQRPPLDPERVTKIMAELLQTYGVNVVQGDHYGSQWPITAFARHGITYAAAPLSASEIYLHSLPLWVSGRVRMLDQPRAVDQLCSLRRKLGQAGAEKIEHPKGGHDDLANCAAGTLWQLTPPKQKVFLGPVPVLTKAEFGGHACHGDNPHAMRHVTSTVVNNYWDQFFR
jgi:hypothetical protein